METQTVKNFDQKVRIWSDKGTFKDNQEKRNDSVEDVNFSKSAEDVLKVYQWNSVESRTSCLSLIRVVVEKKQGYKSLLWQWTIKRGEFRS